MIVFYSGTALNYLQKLDAKTKRRIFEAIDRLPAKGDIQRMKGRKIQNIFRLRVGSSRVLFVIEEEVIKILDVAPRGNAYK
ncbi:MAG: RelE [Candidatus Aminicenantes bacterium]|nr:RelE [Candidatus Aminicenantes bacterium]